MAFKAKRSGEITKSQCRIYTVNKEVWRVKPGALQVSEVRDEEPAEESEEGWISGIERVNKRKIKKAHKVVKIVRGSVLNAADRVRQVSVNLNKSSFTRFVGMQT